MEDVIAGFEAGIERQPIHLRILFITKLTNYQPERYDRCSCSVRLLFSSFFWSLSNNRNFHVLNYCREIGALLPLDLAFEATG